MTFFSEDNHRARKHYICEACLKDIHVGEIYTRYTAQEEGTVYSIPYHPDCREWEIRLCRESELNSDEWVLLHEHVAEGGMEMLDGAPAPVRHRFGVSA